MAGLVISGLAGLVLGLALPAHSFASDQEPATEGSKPDAPQASAPLVAPPGDDLPEPFVPLHPRTGDDRRELDSLRDYVSARAREDRRDFSGAVADYRKALERAPDSTAILRRLSRLNFLLGRGDEAEAFGRRVLEIEPGDTSMILLVLEYHLRKNDEAGAEAILKKILESPKLDPDAAGRLLALRSLGELYAGRLRQPEKAADAFAQVVEALDRKQANDLAPADLRRILGGDEADAYARFGLLFYQANRLDLAIRAFRRGLLYQPDHPDLARFLSQSLLRSGKPEEALAALEPYLKTQPDGREPYDLLVTLLNALNRPDDILSRLEAASRNDPKNTPLQYLLAERYREEGQKDKADALYKHLLATQPDPQGLGALSTNLLKEKKIGELVILLGDAFGKPDTLEAVKPQIESIVNDDELADAVLDAGLELMRDDPPKLKREARLVLAYIATKAKKLDKFIPIQRKALEVEPTPQGYREFWLDLYRNAKYDEAASVLKEMLAKFPDERTPQILIALAQSESLGGKFEAGLASVEDALKMNPTDRDIVRDALRLKGFILGRLYRNDEAIAHYKAMLERFPDDDELVKLARSGLSIIYVNQDKFDQGEAELEILLRRDPDDPGINNDLGYLYADRGKKLEEAEAMIRKAVAAEPDNTAYLDSLGWILYRRGKFEEALEPLKKAAEDTTADATIHDHLGDAYFKLQKFEEARAAWQKAEKIAASSTPPDRKLGDIRKKLESLKSLDPALTRPDGPRP
jgi:tetratricopeptide (TPR) repeat protein